MRIIEPAPGFLDQWLSLRQMLWDDPDDIHLEEAQSILTSDNRTAFLLLDDDEQVIGFIEGALYLEADAKYGYVEGWFVHPDYRGRGLGGRLLEALEQWILHRSISLVLSDTIPAEYPLSPAAHRRHGFKELMTIQVFVRELGEATTE